MTVQSEREAARQEANRKRRMRRWWGAGLAALVIILVTGGLIIHAGSNQPNPKPTPTPTPRGLVSPTPFPLPPTPSALPGSSISVSVNGVKQLGNGNAGTYSWTAPFGTEAVTLVFEGNIPGEQGLPLNICDDLTVYLPPPYSAPPVPTGPQPSLAPGSYGPGPYLAINSDVSRVAGVPVVIPIDPDFQSKPVSNAQWTVDYHFC